MAGVEMRSVKMMGVYRDVIRVMRCVYRDDVCREMVGVER